MDKDNEKRNGHLIIALARAMQAIHRESEVMFYQHGLTMGQFTALEALRHKGPLTMKQLITAVLSTSGNMTVVIANLEKRSFVERKVNPADGRSFLIEITQQGAQLLDKVYELHMNQVGMSLSSLTDQEKDQVITILKKLTKREVQ